MGNGRSFIRSRPQSEGAHLSGSSHPSLAGLRPSFYYLSSSRAALKRRSYSRYSTVLGTPSTGRPHSSQGRYSVRSSKCQVGADTRRHCGTVAVTGVTCPATRAATGTVGPHAKGTASCKGGVAPRALATLSGVYAPALGTTKTPTACLASIAKGTRAVPSTTDRSQPASTGATQGPLRACTPHTTTGAASFSVSVVRTSERDTASLVRARARGLLPS